jgi:hypothetical protein
MSAEPLDREDSRIWVLVRDPGCVLDCKGPFYPSILGFIRELMAARPYSQIDVLTFAHGMPSVEDAGQYLQSRDGRSRPIVLAHYARLKSVRTAPSEAGDMRRKETGK